uniref:Uncharacterized protein n=1 Tax=Gopherus evgoodei TaxID=1825980 RepID=A0A8C4Y8A4_9SAUR
PCGVRAATPPGGTREFKPKPLFLKLLKFAGAPKDTLTLMEVNYRNFSFGMIESNKYKFHSYKFIILISCPIMKEK